MTREFSILLCCQFLVTFSLMVLIPVVPLYLEVLNGGVALSGHWSAVTIAAPAIGALISAPLLGKACDRYGYRRLLLVSLTLFIYSLFAMAAANSLYQFIAARLLLGLAGVSVVLTVYFSQAQFTELALQLAKQQKAIALACLTGPVIGGLSMDSIGLDTMLLSTAFLSCATLFACAKLLTTEPPSTAPQTSSSKTDQRFSPAFMAWLFAGCCAQAGAFALVVGFALYCQSLWQQDPNLATQVGGLHAIAWLATFLFANFWGKRNHLGSATRSFFLGSLGCAIAIAALSWQSSLLFIAITRFIQGACFAALPQTLYLRIGQLTPTHQRGSALGIARSSQVIGQLLGPLSVAFAYDSLGVKAVLWITASWFISAGVAAILPLSFTQLKFKVITK